MAKIPIFLCSIGIAEREDYKNVECLLKYATGQTKSSDLGLKNHGVFFVNQELNQTGAFDLGFRRTNRLNLKTVSRCFLLGSFKNTDLKSLKTELVAPRTFGEWSERRGKHIYAASSHNSILSNSSGGFVTTELPIASFFEKSGSYSNLEGRVQKVKQILPRRF